MNTLTLIGNLTRDPELRTRTESRVCAMRVAESNGPKSSPLFINVSSFGSQAERCIQSLRQGSQIAITGQLRFRQWTAADGSRRSEYSIAAERIDFLQPSNTDPEAPVTTNDGDSDNDPAKTKTANQD